ncbi:hypothetical protein AB0C07_04585 [Actinoplanes missouriensis]|uniref:hypothetical protein n=1 Tax=Actinoplanes missouriensis TaxID=1866 RepID=UPI00340F3590
MRTTGSDPDDPASGASAAPVRRLPPIGPSPNPNEARPTEADLPPEGDEAAGEDEAAEEDEAAGEDEAADEDEAGDAGPAEAADARLPVADAGDGDADAANAEDPAVPELDDAAGLVGCRGGIVVRVADRAVAGRAVADRVEVRVGRPGDSAAFVAGTNGFGRNDSSSVPAGAESADPGAPAPNQPPAGASDGLASGIVAPGRR